MKVFQPVGRKIVVHETCFLDRSNVLNAFQRNDVVFFDDCLYSQYLFIEKNNDVMRKKNVTCVLGLSTRVVRTSLNPKIEGVCSQCHDAIHAGNLSALDAYMSIDEVKELLSNENVFLACHGANHLKLDEMQSKVKASVAFVGDVEKAIDDLKAENLSSDIFVFPYAYDDIILAYFTLNKFGFKHIFAGQNTKRIPIESLLSNQSSYLE